MKKLHLHHFAVLPLFALMAVSPFEIESSTPYRSIASVVQEESEHPRYDEMAGKIQREALLKDQSPSEEKIKEKISALKEEIKSLEGNTKVEKDKIEKLVISSILIDESIKVLGSTNEELKPVILDIEKILTAQVTEEEKPKADIEVAVEDPKPGEEKASEEGKKEEEKKTEYACEHEEKNILLTKQVETLLDDQKKIMDTILGMAQMMVSMFQQQQQLQMPNPYYANGPGWNVQSPYQYQQPFTAGNWVYYPSGFQPNQGNIFGQGQAPAAPQSQPALQGQGIPQAAPLHQGFYPDQANVQESWSLRPEMSFQPTPFTGTFGMDPMSFNFSNFI